MVGNSLSVSGEVYRYEANFARAWAAYLEAEAIFQETKSWPWLGTLYQEMAICCTRRGGSGSSSSRTSRTSRTRPTWRWSSSSVARHLRDFNVRAYPSALNRAGRILAAAGPSMPDCSTSTRASARRAARRRLVVLGQQHRVVEHAYRAWTDTDEGRYRASSTSDVRASRRGRDLPLPRHRSRWELLQGHLITTDALRSGDTAISIAITHYSTDSRSCRTRASGPRLCGHRQGVRRFRELFDQLPRQSSEVGHPPE